MIIPSPTKTKGGNMTEQPKWKNWDEVPLVLGVKETAALLGVHYNTVKNMIHRGDLTAVKVGRSWRIQREAIKAMLEGGQSDAD